MSVNGYKIHPAADIFPMMSADELQELADDIAANGLEHPIMLDHEGKQVVDGRNRLEACKLAKVDPVFERLPAEKDVVTHIISVNLKHRFLNKGQRAMAEAILNPDIQPGKKKSSSVSEKVSTTRLSYARAVLRYSRPLADSVLMGTTPLDDALTKVKQEQQYQQSDEAKLQRLQKAAPDLAEQVDEERLKVNEAIAALNAREQELRQICEDAQRAARNIVGTFVAQVLSIVSGIEHGEEIAISEESASELKEGYSMFLERVIKKGR